MKDVVVIGAGKIGATVAQLLASTGDYQVTLADRSAEALAGRDRNERIRALAADVEDSSTLVVPTSQPPTNASTAIAQREHHALPPGVLRVNKLITSC
jgi:3-hydroxyacyl-CoA dehydrogenase